ncbi:MAG: tRNA uridine-5-carboxymethylaminomethyl(34) synthesis GTPase MnmE [Bacillota bacterium]
MFNDTIAAIITAMGAASVGIIRISGPDAFEIGKKIYKGNKDFNSLQSHSVTYGKVYDSKEDKIIDEALFLYMKKPATFTGEDVIEIQCHGGMIPLRKIIELVMRNGARLADPGEFSKRAFLNGKLDLSQAEAIMDIVNAKTEKGLDIAVNHLQGQLSVLVNNAREELLRLVAYIEADIDFPDDDIERLQQSQQLSQLLAIKNKVENILETAHKGKIIKEGLNVVIIGQPNVGKSSLLNALLKESRAIVTDIPGTTRDSIEEFINLGGIPIKIIDTAGIRKTENIVEKIGVEKAKELIKKADLVLYVFDILNGVQDEDLEIINNYLEDVQVIFLINKVDLEYKQKNISQIKGAIGQHPLVQISAKENEGIDLLEKQISEMFFAGQIQADNETILTNIRHVDAFQKSIYHLEGAVNSIESNMPGDFVVIDIKGAWENLGKVTGDTIEEDILDKIFSQFCLGK